MVKKFFGARGGSADQQAASQNGEQAVAVVPVATTDDNGRPTVEWATLGMVPVAQCVPASPTFKPYEGQLSPVTAETVARLLGSKTQQTG